jgi:hypothetical protein
MTKISESYASRSHVLLLLEQQKYDEALAILTDLRDKEPSDREIRVYYLLLLRIFVLRWNLSRASTGPVNETSAVSKTGTAGFASLARLFGRLKLIRSFIRNPQAELSSSSRSTKRLMFVGAGSGFLMLLLGLCMIGDDERDRLVSAHLPRSTDVSHPTVSPSDENTLSPNADKDLRRTQLGREAGERKIFRIASESTELMPAQLMRDVLKSHLRDFGGQEFMASEIDRAKPMHQLNSSKPLIRQTTAGRKNIGTRASRETPGRYQSRWAIPIREFPRFAAATVQRIDRGVSLNVLEFHGSWAKVRLAPAGATGFIRREFLISAKEAESKVTRTSPSMKGTRNATGFVSGSTS